MKGRNTHLYHSFKNVLWGLSCIVAALHLSSCDKEEFFGSCFKSGETIMFSAKSSYAGKATKTSYYSVKDDKWINGIQWVKDDRLSIYCPQAVIYNRATQQHITPPVAEYKVVAPYDGVTLNPNEAIIASVSDDEENSMDLDWGEEVDHEFRAVYPAVGTTVNGQQLTTLSYAWWGGDANFYYTLPENQYYKSYSSSSGNYVAEPHMEYLLMMAHKTIHPRDRAKYGIEEDGTKHWVFLDFKPMMTAIEFTLVSGFTSGTMTPEYVGITSTNHILAGTAYLNYNSTGSEVNVDGMAFERDVFSPSSNTVKLYFSDNVTIAEGKTLQFTLFFLDGADDLTFLYKDKNLGIKKLAIKKADFDSLGNPVSGGYLSFPRYSKSYIKGVIVPNDSDVKWDVAFEAEAAYWRNQNIDATVSHHD